MNEDQLRYLRKAIEEQTAVQNEQLKVMKRINTVAQLVGILIILSIIFTVFNALFLF